MQLGRLKVNTQLPCNLAARRAVPKKRQSRPLPGRQARVLDGLPTLQKYQQLSTHGSAVVGRIGRDDG